MANLRTSCINFADKYGKLIKNLYDYSKIMAKMQGIEQAKRKFEQIFRYCKVKRTKKQGGLQEFERAKTHKLEDFCAKN